MSEVEVGVIGGSCVYGMAPIRPAVGAVAVCEVEGVPPAILNRHGPGGAVQEALDGGTVVVVNGPRFATRAESRWFHPVGATLVNMTRYSEAVLAHELGLAHAAIGSVADHDAGVDDRPHVAPATREAVFAEFDRHVPRLRDVVLSAAVAPT